MERTKFLVEFETLFYDNMNTLLKDTIESNFRCLKYEIEDLDLSKQTIISILDMLERSVRKTEDDMKHMIVSFKKVEK